jgi:hypothetical protein
MIRGTRFFIAVSLLIGAATIPASAHGAASSKRSVAGASVTANAPRTTHNAQRTTQPAVTVPGAPNCPIFPATNVWNRPVNALPVAKNSARIIKSIGKTIGLHPDFGSYAGYGIPYNVVGSSTPMVPVKFTLYGDQSDKGPYPIPANPKIEGGSDRHMLIVDSANCHLYELWLAQKTKSGTWEAGSGAIWNLESNHLRRAGWTSADAAGLPILPGLVRYDEVQGGAIDHALRFTVNETRRAYVYPARHEAGDTNSKNYPPMGLRLRLKASVSLAGFSAEDRVLLTAMKTYGLIVADNGTSWYVQGASDPRWNDSDLHLIDRIKGSDFVVVNTSHFRNGS